jgi:ATP-dependent RNA helicase DeaD
MPFVNLSPSLERALADKGYAEPTPVQAAVLQPEAEGRDLLVSAQTGSGKTVAYGLALGPTLMGEGETLPPPGPPLALIVAPTRELALQVERELHWLYAGAKARVAVCVGGMDARREQRVLAAGCHIVVATPGRLRDHLERGNFDASALRAVVLDEADEMLDLGFRDDLEFILDATPPERRTLLFSATLAREIVTLARSYQRDALRIDTQPDVQHADIEYKAFLIAPNEIEHAVVNVLRFFDSRGSIVFCHTREAVRHMHSNLVERGFAAVALSGELSQNERTLALQSLRDGRARVLVATDVAARGLDLPDLGLVIHAELPQNRAALLHRSGRTGRAGKKGVSVLLVPYTRRRRAEQVLQAAGLDAGWSGPPSADEIRKLDQERLLHDPLLTDETPEDDLALARALLEGRSAEDIAAALIRLYRARLPSPEELFDGGAYKPKPGDKPARGPRESSDAGGDSQWDRGAREQGSGGVWFRLNVGREKNADPKWLIPLICRRGHVTKPDIGAIRIFGRETKFEIVPAAAERFAAAVAGAIDDGVKIEPSAAPAPQEKFRAPRDAAPREFKPREDRPVREDRPPREDKPRDFKPREDRPREHAPAAEAARPTEYKPREDKPRDFKPREDRPRESAPGAEAARPTAYKPRDDKPRADKPRYDKPREDKPRYDKPRDFKPREDKPYAGKPRTDAPREAKPRPYNPMDNKPGETASAPDRAREDRGGPFKVGPRPFKKKPGRKSNDQRPGKPHKGPR